MMNVLDYSCILGTCVLATSLAIRAVPAVGEAVLADGKSRKHALDGLRGILALSVLIHHEMLGHAFGHAPTADQVRDHPFVMQTGAASVALFFMISAYLFGGKIIRHGGALDIMAFFRGRLLRIVPLYLFAVASTIVISLSASGFELVEPISKVGKEIARHLLFHFVPRYGIDGFDQASTVLGQVWSLKFEWLLYFLIPLIALVMRSARSAWIIHLPLLLCAVFYSSFFYFFIAGVLCAQLESFRNLRLRYAVLAAATVAPVLLVVAFSASENWVKALLFIPLLLAVVQETGWARLLGARPLCFLGEISFGIYLLHGIIFTIWSLWLGGANWADMNGTQFLIVGSVLALAVVALSTATYLAIERPFMHIRPSPKSASSEPLPAVPL